MGNLTNPAMGDDAARVAHNAISFTAGVSEVIDTKGTAIMGCFLPSGGANNGELSFQAASEADGTYVPVNDESGSLITVTVDAASEAAVPFGASIFNQLAAFRYIKLVNSGETSDWIVTTRFVA